jgi:uncharacterized protein with GYD domain
MTATYIILSQLTPGALTDPKEFKKLAEVVSEKIKRECPAVAWKQSYATMGRIDVVDVVESEDPIQVEKAAMIIRALGRCNTETLVATPWKEFLGAL